jgi:hypothetical protein
MPDADQFEPRSPAGIRVVAPAGEDLLNTRGKRARPLPAVAGIRPVTCAQRTKLLTFRLRYQISLGVSAEGACSLAVRMPRQRMIHGRVLPVVSGVATRVRGFGCLRWYTKKAGERKKKHRGSEDTDCVRR